MAICKNYPRDPKSTMVELGFGCPNRDDKNNNDIHKLNKCLFCGIASKSFVLGSLATLREQTGHPVAFFERVKCDSFEKLDLESIERVGSHIIGYTKSEDDTLYRYVFADIFRNENAIYIQGKKCMERRRNEECFNARCSAMDLAHAHEAYQAFDRDGDSYFNSINIDRQGYTYSIDYHLYYCKAEGFTEMIIPIYSSSTKKSIMGMLIRGQCYIEEVKCLQDQWATENGFTDEEKKLALRNWLLNQKTITGILQQ